MFVVPRRSARSRSGSTTPTIQEDSPKKKKKVRHKGVKINKTFEALSKMAKGNISKEPAYKKQFGGIKDIKLSDYASEPNDVPGNTKSIYSGAGIKLDAFDCFHKVLNECVYDYTFSISDAALILKQLTPDIIKKIVPLLSQQQQHSHATFQRASIEKKQQEDKTEYYEQEPIDLEVTQINIKEKSKNINSKTSIKRPDASRPTRMLSPGSNSCSPVSAAVQALISISAPITDSIETCTNSVSKLSKNKPTYYTSVHENNKIDNKTVFVPLSKPISNSEYTASLFVPAVASTCSNKTAHHIVKKEDSTSKEVAEVLTISKNEFFNSTQSSISFFDSLPSQTKATSTVRGYVHETNTEICPPQFTECKTSSEAKYSFSQLQQMPLAQDDPLPHFGLLLNTAGLSVDLPCGLPSPFQQHFPPSPMPSVINASTSSTSNTNTTVVSSAPTSSNILPQTTQQAIISTQQFMSPVVTVSSEQQPFMDQTQQYVHDEAHISVSVTNVRLQNPLRTILPKPDICSPNATAVVSVMPSTLMSSVTSVSQLSPVIKIDEKKSMQYSVPPSQIFTKINPIANSNQLPHIPLVTMSMSPHRQLFPNQGYFFPPQAMEAMMFAQQQQQKDQMKQYINQPINLANFKTKTEMSSDILMLPQMEDKMPSLNLSGKPESGSGNLEVASALLSMGHETKQLEEKEDGRGQTLSEIIQNSIKYESEQVMVTFTDDGVFKIEDVEINPRKHKIEKDNFTCGKCNRVFTTILYLARHIKRVCPDMSQRKWKCDRCDKAFRHPFGLNQHIYTHTGERPHKCEQCVKAFYSANDLRRHMRTHSGERPYHCTHCDKTFSTTISLKTHTYIHTGERPHRCPHCPKTFATASKLSRHVVTHSEKRPFPCDQCAKTFNRSGDLRRHYSQHHGKSNALLECDQCNKVFATQKCLYNHKSSHKRDDPMIAPQNNNVEQDLLRSYAYARF